MIKLPKLQSFLVSINTHLLKLVAFAALFFILGAFLSPYFQYPTGGTKAFKTNSVSKAVISPLKRPGDPPVMAYWIYGSRGDGRRILRLLKATYHPRNQYLLLLDAMASPDERAELAVVIQSDPLYAAFDNVNVVGKSYAVNQTAGSGLAAVLHAAALLLKISTAWDWFVTLSAYDYPLLTQDDILHAFTLLPRNLNFVQFANTTGPNEMGRVKQIVVDPSLYSKKSRPILYTTETRDVPNTFKVLAGSPWVILSRPFVDFCVNGWDNVPRKLLMYLSNVAYPLELYFQTVLCNSPAFQNTTIDRDLRYVLTNATHATMAVNKAKAAIIARPFKEDDGGVLAGLDRNLLHRSPDGVVPGRWCVGRNANTTGVRERNCSRWGDINSVEASPRGVRLGLVMSRFPREGGGRLRSEECGRG